MDRYNTFSGRFMAGIVDGLVLLPITIIDLFLINSERPIGLVLTWILISYSIFFVYSIIFHWKTGQTIGKRVMKIKVVDVLEEKGLTFRQAFLRDSVYVVLQIIGIILIFINVIKTGVFTDLSIEPYSSYLDYLALSWFLLEIITMFTNKKRRAFHDYMAKTVVVNI